MASYFIIFKFECYYLHCIIGLFRLRVLVLGPIASVVLNLMSVCLEYCASKIKYLVGLFECHIVSFDGRTRPAQCDLFYLTLVEINGKEYLLLFEID
jgi:hypothetical protein